MTMGRGGARPWAPRTALPTASISSIGVIPAMAVLGEAEAEGHGADELAVDINGAAAHAG